MGAEGFPLSHPMYNPWLHRYAILLAICTFLLVAAGATVTSKEAGLSVPDWPLSYGKVMPEMTGGVMFEHGHRMIATTVGMLTIGLVIWLFRTEQRAWMRKLGLAALGAVIVQGVLGGLTVLLLLPPAVSVSHACLAQCFFSTTIATAIFTSRSWIEGPEPVSDHGWPPLRTLAVIAPLMVLVQIALGAAFRHRAIGLLPHLVGAMVVTFGLLILGAFVLNQFPNHKSLRPAGIYVLGMVFFQVFLGIAAYWGRLVAETKPTVMLVTTIAHVAGGGLTLAATVAVSIHILRHVQPRTVSAAEETAAVAR